MGGGFGSVRFRPYRDDGSACHILSEGGKRDALVAMLDRLMDGVGQVGCPAAHEARCRDAIEPGGT